MPVTTGSRSDARPGSGPPRRWDAPRVARRRRRAGHGGVGRRPPGVAALGHPRLRRRRVDPGDAARPVRVRLVPAPAARGQHRPPARMRGSCGAAGWCSRPSRAWRCSSPPAVSRSSTSPACASSAPAWRSWRWRPPARAATSPGSGWSSASGSTRSQHASARDPRPAVAGRRSSPRSPSWSWRSSPSLVAERASRVPLWWPSPLDADGEVSPVWTRGAAWPWLGGRTGRRPHRRPRRGPGPAGPGGRSRSSDRSAGAGPGRWGGRRRGGAGAGARRADHGDPRRRPRGALHPRRAAARRRRVAFAQLGLPIAIGLVLGAPGTTPGDSGPRRRGSAAAGSLLLFLLLGFVYYAAYELPLPFVNQVFLVGRRGGPRFHRRGVGAGRTDAAPRPPHPAPGPARRRRRPGPRRLHRGGCGADVAPAATGSVG